MNDIFPDKHWLQWHSAFIRAGSLCNALSSLHHTYLDDFLCNYARVLLHEILLYEVLLYEVMLYEVLYQQLTITQAELWP